MQVFWQTACPLKEHIYQNIMISASCYALLAFIVASNAAAGPATILQLHVIFSEVCVA
jgi:hypothetical protein